MKELTRILVIAFIALVIGIILGNRTGHPRGTTAVPDTVRTVIVDTNRIMVPVPRDSLVIRYEVHSLPVILPPDTQTSTPILPPDTAAVIVPITQTEYSDSTYRAWVSGYAAALDSIYIYPRKEVVTIRHPPPKRWSFGIHAGAGVTPLGPQPYIGIGVSYSIYQF